MIKAFKSIFMSLGLIVSITAATLVPAVAFADDTTTQPTTTDQTGGGTSGGSGGNGAVDVFSGCSGNTSAVCNSANGADGTTFGKIMKNIINTVLVVLGMIAVIMIVVGGIRYTTSNGDSSSITAAKNTILYAVVGLVVAILSFAIVNFVLSNIGK